jgi:hypothetical protein
MGSLICKTCGATAEGDTFDDADSLIDHSVGTSKGKPCGGNPLDMIWTGVIRATKTDDSPQNTKTKRSKK